MRIVLLAVLLVAVPLASAKLPANVNAAGTATLTVTDGSGASCTAPAAIVVHVATNGLAGAIAWDAPACPGAAGADAFSLSCVDVCFADCGVTSSTASCGRGGPGGWTQFVLQRDGAFTMDRSLNGVSVSASGLLTVVSWQ